MSRWIRTYYHYQRITYNCLHSSLSYRTPLLCDYRERTAGYLVTSCGFFGCSLSYFGAFSSFFHINKLLHFDWDSSLQSTKVLGPPAVQPSINTRQVLSLREVLERTGKRRVNVTRTARQQQMGLIQVRERERGKCISQEVRKGKPCVTRRINLRCFRQKTDNQHAEIMSVVLKQDLMPSVQFVRWWETLHNAGVIRVLGTELRLARLETKHGKSGAAWLWADTRL